MVPRSSDRISRVPPYLIRAIELRIRGCHPLRPSFPTGSSHSHASAGPRSLATTGGVSVDVLSSGYLDVSVPRVRSFSPMCSDQKYLSQPPMSHPKMVIDDRQVGCPIRKSMDQNLLSVPHGLSQITTSFIASCCLGIHQTPFSRLIRPSEGRTLRSPRTGRKHTFRARPARDPRKDHVARRACQCT